jgi:hypothetical protein
MAEELDDTPNLFQLIGPPVATDPGSIYDYDSSTGEKLQSGFGRQWDTNPFASGFVRPLNMLNEDLMAIAGAAEWVSADKAREDIAKSGLDLTVPDNGVSKYELETLKYLKKREREQQQLSARNTSMLGTAAEFTGGLAAGVIDPLNVASAFIPIVPEARYAAWVAQSSGVFGRAAVRAGAGAAEGVAGAALLEPLSYYGATNSQLEYTAADSFINVVFGGVMGAGLHSVGGAALDVAYPTRLRDYAGQAPDDVKLAALHDAVRALEEDRPVDATETFFRDMAERHGATDREFLNRTADFDDESVRAAREVVVMARAGEDEKTSQPGLLQTIRAMGGIKVRDAEGNLTREGAEVMAVLQDVRYPGLINNKRGMPADSIREALTEDGWFRSRDNGETDLQELFDMMDRAGRGEKVLPYGESAGKRLKGDFQRQLDEAGVKPGDSVAAASIKLAEYRAALQRERFDEPDFEPEEIIWREPGEEDDLAGPVTDEILARYERADGYDDGMAEVSALADRAAMKSDDIEQVAADTDFLDQQINGMKSRDMWSAADEAALAMGEVNAKKLETTATVYRAAAVCMTE